jgi:hypothetical protein
MLLYAGWSENDTIRFTFCVNEAAKCDASLSEVKSTVQDSKQKIDGKQAATGGPELAKLVGVEVVQRIRDWLALNKAQKADYIPNLIVYDLMDFLTQTFPESEPLVTLIKPETPIFRTCSINQIFAWRGTGKTMLALTLAGTIARGENFLRWRATRKARVLYVEGEMPASQLQQRARELIGATELGFFRILAFTSQVEDIQYLSTPAGRKAIETNLGDAEVLILDSISTLGGFATNDEEHWLEFLHWLNQLRRRGLCIIFLHHAGKSGMQRGHSRSEDMLDVSIKLTRSEEDQEVDWLKVTMEYDKFRADRRGVRTTVVEYKEGRWLDMLKDSDKLKTLEEYMCAHPTASARAVTRDLPWLGSPPTVLKLMKKLKRYTEDREKGMV